MALQLNHFDLPHASAVMGSPETGRPEAPNGALLVDIVRVGGTSGPDCDWVAQEIPVSLVYNGISHAVMMTTPRDLEAFAVGFSLAEGIVKSTDEIYGIEVEDACRGKEVRLDVASSAFWALKARRRSMAGRTGCGLCGVESLGEAVRPTPTVPHTQRFSIRHLDQALAYLNDAEELGRLTGCTHAAVWVNPDGTLAGGAEDVGRHVALDKLLGKRAMNGWKEGALVLSSRASYEMVSKAAACGVEIIFAVSAPTALAVDTAREAGVTLAAFCRRGRANIYAHPERLTDLQDLHLPN